jgi:hypothetical protein
MLYYIILYIYITYCLYVCFVLYKLIYSWMLIPIPNLKGAAVLVLGDGLNLLRRHGGRQRRPRVARTA